MTGIYISSDTRGLGGTVKTTIDQVAIDGPHLGVQIGGYITVADQQPQTDESETEVHRLQLITRNLNDSDAIGLMVESANAGFASSFFGVTCIGSFSKCFDVKDSGTLYLNSLNCGLGGPDGRDRICLLWEAGVTGTVINTIDDDRPGHEPRVGGELRAADLGEEGLPVTVGIAGEPARWSPAWCRRRPAVRRRDRWCRTR